METKPVVTCYGDSSLFSGLQAHINRGLPKEATEWKRSYGRSSKFVCLDASFVPYDDDILPTENDKSLISRPFFHIYWTECDVDNYKQSVREDITEWHTALKKNNIPDWLIVVVVSDESKVKAKLLPRSSVIDRVKSDFCGKQVDRCIVLTEPHKGDQRCMDSWNNFYQRLRQLLLQSFNRHLSKYEENMRSLRERRNEQKWSFSEYFLVQEELAFMFEMLGVYDDSLLQYDELDALFTQFLLNHAAGETVDWLTPFIEPCTKWAGISLSKALNWDKRDLIKMNKASLLEFRNYLFSRQCALLSLLNRPWEIAERAVAYLHNTVQEMKTLEIEMPEGSLACWVFLSCLEVLHTSDKLNNSTEKLNSHSLYTASLWDYARKKLKELGVLCGLMPEVSSNPTSEQLNKVVDLLFGMGINEEEASTTGSPRPIDRLREALSSRQSFQRHYLDLSELAMGTYKHIGRMRSARIIGQDVAEFYMKQESPQKAEGFLLDAMKMYKQEGWDILSDGIAVLLAQCQKKLSNPLKYAKTACYIVCSKNLSHSERCYYLDELIQLSRSDDGNSLYIQTNPAFSVDNIVLNTPVATFQDEMSIELEIFSNLPREVSISQISLGFSHEASEGSQKRSLSRQPSLYGTVDEPVMNFQTIRPQLPSKINVVSATDVKQEKLQSSSIICTNTNELLKRADSIQGPVSDSIYKLNYKLSLTAKDVLIKPGVNLVTVKSQVDSCKRGLYKLGQLCIEVGQLEFIRHNMANNIFVEIVCQQPFFEVNPSAKIGELISGIKQDVELTLNTCSIPVTEGSILSVNTSSGLSAFYNDESDVKIPLEAVSVNSSVTMNLQLQHILTKDPAEATLTFESSFLHYPISCHVTFYPPLQFSHKVFSCQERKYIQVEVKGNHQTPFSLTKPHLKTVDNNDVDFTYLGHFDKWQEVHNDQSICYMWQLRSNAVPGPSSLDLIFSVTYRSSMDEDSLCRLSVYNIHLENIQTLYMITSNIIPGNDNKTCKVGNVCHLDFSVINIDTSNTSSESQLLYEVVVDHLMWAVCGRVTGIVTLTNSKFDTQLQIIPLMAGFLPFPLITLAKYKPKTDSSEDSENDPSCDFYKEHFKSEQVHNSSLGKQIHIYSEQSSGNLETMMVY
ncbi:trafficking protein particle complex subunit 10 [Octopus bimaculoides]|uniref:Trafficking protein particle complex subunit 10 n=1 Tax=Octopus bimaculoides TaxID=37653 RepID=A0A0L8HAZ3_OCTBM|nr:trafficking protein particle complex subunit 10 [Octopus bimaculoides]|eukprot:XP_014773822.1 PREDICTED: trafficking protein particle complex subunit 10-like [Octopus bimaculoides]